MGADQWLARWIVLGVLALVVGLLVMGVVTFRLQLQHPEGAAYDVIIYRNATPTPDPNTTPAETPLPPQWAIWDTDSHRLTQPTPAAWSLNPTPNPGDTVFRSKVTIHPVYLGAEVFIGSGEWTTTEAGGW